MIEMRPLRFAHTNGIRMGYYEARRESRTPILSPEEKQVFVDTFTRTGFTGGINWYRNMSRNWQRTAGLDHTVRVPSLMIMAENDAVLPPSVANGMERLIPDLEKYLVRGSGHWTQQERPGEVSAKLIEWRRRRLSETYGVKAARVLTPARCFASRRNDGVN